MDGASETIEYTYDNNGNLTKDSNKGISNIAYNCLNLPSKVTFSDGSTITYSYAADGTKLRMVHTISGTTTTKDYCANVVYENGIQKMLLTEEGYVDLSASTSTYYYYLKDHQGNNRVVINSSGAVQETNHYYPFGDVFASTGNVQPYKYNGKELDTKKGLNWYDYEARHYDATLGRWFVVDPLAEKMNAWSPYAYCFNNPMKFVDEEGKIPLIIPLVKGLIGAAIDATTQVSISMLTGNSFSEAVGNIDVVSVGKSFVTSAISGVKIDGKVVNTILKSTAAACEVVDAAVDVNYTDGIEYIGSEEKEISDAVIDVSMSFLGNGLADGFINSFKKAISEDLSSKAAATLTKETKTNLKKTRDFVSSYEFETAVSAITGFATGGVGEMVKRW